MTDKIYKRGQRVWIRTLGDDQPLMRWFMDPRCPLSERQLRRRCEAILSGAMHMSVEDAVTKRCKSRGVKPRDRKKEKAQRKKKMTETELWQEQCQQVASGRLRLPEREVEETPEPVILSEVEALFSPRLVDRLRYRDMVSKLGR